MRVIAVGLAALATPASVRAEDRLDYDVSGGHFYTQANGSPMGPNAGGFSISDANNIPFWSYFSAQPRFGYLRKAVSEIERTWVTQLERGQEDGTFRADLDAWLTYRLLRDVLWIPSQWRLAEGYSTEQVAGALLRLLFDGITAKK